jgi:hypothetical protein
LLTTLTSIEPMLVAWSGRPKIPLSIFWTASQKLLAFPLQSFSLYRLGAPLRRNRSRRAVNRRFLLGKSPEMLDNLLDITVKRSVYRDSKRGFLRRRSPP